MDNWKIQLVVVTFCALVQTYQALSSTVEEERGLPKDWQDESLEAGLTQPMISLMKRSKALRFYGLMGKRSGTKKPFQVNRRNKGETFVGLMGRSISSGGKHKHQETKSDFISKFQGSFIDIKNIKLLIHI
uniref:Si:ch211-131k2.2 n=1 Tax=Dicentrarchus labrax TaxID=13489 RepID=A0A8P4FYS0_DICLA